MSSTLAWKILWTGEPDRLQSMGWLRVRHNWTTSLSLFTFTHWKRKWQPKCSCLENPRDGGAWWTAVFGSHRVRHNWRDLVAAAAAQKSPVKACINNGLSWSQGDWLQQSWELQCAGINPFEGDNHYCHFPNHTGQITGRWHRPTNWQKIGLNIYWGWTCPPGQDPVFPTASPCYQEASKASYPHPSEGRQNENHNHRTVTKLITWITTLSNSMELWAVPCRATQMNGSCWRILTKIQWFTEEGDGKPLKHSCLENPMNSMKRENDRILKEKLLRSVGIQYADGESHRNSSKRNEDAESKWKQHTVVEVSGGESKERCSK